jgi:hypothetical protein
MVDRPSDGGVPGRSVHAVCPQHVLSHGARAGYEWLRPIDPLIYLLAEVLAVATSFGPLALPFVKAPGRVLRAAVMTSLALGALANVAWMFRGFFLCAFSFYFTVRPAMGTMR